MLSVCIHTLVYTGGEDDYDPLADALGITGGGGEGGPDDSKVSLI